MTFKLQCIASLLCTPQLRDAPLHRQSMHPNAESLMHLGIVVRIDSSPGINYEMHPIILYQLPRLSKCKLAALKCGDRNGIVCAVGSSEHLLRATTSTILSSSYRQSISSTPVLDLRIEPTKMPFY